MESVSWPPPFAQRSTCAMAAVAMGGGGGGGGSLFASSLQPAQASADANTHANGVATQGLEEWPEGRWGCTEGVYHAGRAVRTFCKGLKSLLRRMGQGGAKYAFRGVKFWLPGGHDACSRTSGGGLHVGPGVRIARTL